jgi:serine/threonine protein kinase
MLDFDVQTFSIIMELMPLGTLSHNIKKNQLKAWIQRKQIMMDICEGGAFLHASIDSDGNPKRVVFHQDLKSPNVLIYKDDKGALRAKIADFGLAFLKEMHEEGSMLVKRNGGTQTYMAPELFQFKAMYSKAWSCNN